MTASLESGGLDSREAAARDFSWSDSTEIKEKFQSDELPFSSREEMQQVFAKWGADVQLPENVLTFTPYNSDPMKGELTFPKTVEDGDETITNYFLRMNIDDAQEVVSKSAQGGAQGPKGFIQSANPEIRFKSVIKNQAGEVESEQYVVHQYSSVREGQHKQRFFKGLRPTFFINRQKQNGEWIISVKSVQ